VDFTVNRPVTRSQSWDNNKLVSEQEVMGDSSNNLQVQFETFMKMYQENRQHDRTEREHLSARIEELSRDLAATRLEAQHGDNGSVNRGHPQAGNRLEGCVQLPRYSRLEFPLYDGKIDPLAWLSRYDHFFRHQHIPEEEKVEIASYHLDEDAQVWFLKLDRDRPGISWEEFKRQCHLRFGPSIQSNKLGELSKLRQGGTVEEFQRKFEQLAARAGPLTTEQEVEIFISGLQEYIAIEVELHRPKDLISAMSLAHLYERRSGAKRFIPSANKPSSNTSSGSSNQKTFKRLSRHEMDERRAKGLCFNCDEVYNRGHQCKRLFWLDGVDESVQEDNEDHEFEEDLPPEISLHAIMGENSGGKTMRIQGIIGHHHLLILIDSGSTHSFLGSRWVTKLGLTCEPMKGLQVVVANGSKIRSPGQCPNVPVMMGNQLIHIDFYIFKLNEVDAVLGVNWLQTLGPILWDFKAKSMVFKQNGRVMELQGTDSPHSTPTIQLQAANMESPFDTDLDNLLTEFDAIFQEPRGLSPARSYDHRINLEPGTHPVVVRPYRYPHAQKDEIERQCKDMLERGIIKPSQSPYSSPVLLVTKADNTWRFCADYRALNSKTIKDKFPIPVVDELLEELHGAKYFTKLDLRSGYHQIRMYPTDIEKTAFRTHHGHFEFLVMPFGLTNAPSTFQALMNEVFQLHLRKFILVFFDDILVYSHSWTDHLAHLQLVFDILAIHQLFLKRSKCCIAQRQVSYLGHIISREGVAIDNSKITAMIDWPKPTTVKGLQGFLGLTGYYRKFVQNYGNIAGPLTAMLRKDSFTWTDEATQAFEHLKIVMTSTPVLALPDFTTLFILGCDASDTGMGAVLQQNGQPIAYFSRPLASRYKSLPAYEKELIGLAKAVRHWRAYLWGRHFLIRTDHYSLKCLLDQRIITSPQQHWLSKLMGFDFAVEYRAGKHNTVADALSRCLEDQPSLTSISIPLLSLFNLIRLEIQKSDQLQLLLSNIQKEEAVGPWEYKDGLIFFKRRVYLLHTSHLVQSIISALHDSGHEGYQKTLHRVAQDFYWQGMKTSIQTFVRHCVVCQKHKTEHLHPAGFLQPLPIPLQIWSDISMDFIEGLPPSQGKSVLLVVVERFSKYTHLLPLAHPYTTMSVARLFFDNIFKLHGLPETIVSDRDVTFTSLFWTELFRLSGTKLAFSTAYHP